MLRPSVSVRDTHTQSKEHVKPISIICFFHSVLSVISLVVLHHCYIIIIMPIAKPGVPFELKLMAPDLDFTTDMPFWTVSHTNSAKLTLTPIVKKINIK